MDCKVINPRWNLPRRRSISRRAIPLTWNRCLDQREHSPITSAGYGDGVVGTATEKLASCWKFELCDSSGMMGEVSEFFVVRVLDDRCAGNGRKVRCC